MNSVWVQEVATFAVGVLAWLLAYIALGARRFSQSGREALLCASAYLFVTAAVRTLSTNDVITAETGRILSGVAALTAATIIAQIAWLHRIETKIEKKEEP